MEYYQSDSDKNKVYPEGDFDYKKYEEIMKLLPLMKSTEEKMIDALYSQRTFRQKKWGMIFFAAILFGTIIGPLICIGFAIFYAVKESENKMLASMYYLDLSSKENKRPTLSFREMFRKLGIELEDKHLAHALHTVLRAKSEVKRLKAIYKFVPDEIPTLEKIKKYVDEFSKNILNQICDDQNTIQHILGKKKDFFSHLTNHVAESFYKDQLESVIKTVGNKNLFRFNYEWLTIHFIAETLIEDDILLQNEKIAIYGELSTYASEQGVTLPPFNLFGRIILEKEKPEKLSPLDKLQALFLSIKMRFEQTLHELKNEQEYTKDIDIDLEFSALIYLITDVRAMQNNMDRQLACFSIGKVLDEYYPPMPEKFDARVTFYASFVNGKNARGEFLMGSQDNSSGLYGAMIAFGDILHNHSLLEDYDNAPLFMRNFLDNIDFAAYYLDHILPIFEYYAKNVVECFSE